MEGGGIVCSFGRLHSDAGPNMEPCRNCSILLRHPWVKACLKLYHQPVYEESCKDYASDAWPAPTWHRAAIVAFFDATHVAWLELFHQLFEK